MPRAQARVLVVGAGGREHALAWSLLRSPRVGRVYVAPGNGGTAGEPGMENVPHGADDPEALLDLALSRQVDLTVVGPEGPLAAGLADRFQAAGLTVFGPTGRAARLESTKVWAREFMARHGIPHPWFTVADDVETAERAVREVGGHCVVKADGLAAGKGVLVCDGVESALRAVRTVMVERKFGAAGARALIENRMAGPEISLMVATDGRDYVLFPPAQDYKRLEEGDRGPNTGGMGSYAPAPIATPDLVERVRREVVEPTLAGMRAEGCPFRGCLYCGLMLTEIGPVVIEFNVRFGDPETQSQLPVLGVDLYEVLLGAACGDLGSSGTPLRPGLASVCVVLASEGYPESSSPATPIQGIEAAERVEGVKVFHAGTRAQDGGVVAAGGRVLNVTCVRGSLGEAVVGAYEAIGPQALHFDRMRYRRDIAARALT